VVERESRKRIGCRGTLKGSNTVVAGKADGATSSKECSSRLSKASLKERREVGKTRLKRTMAKRPSVEDEWTWRRIEPPSFAAPDLVGLVYERSSVAGVERHEPERRDCRWSRGKIAAVQASSATMDRIREPMGGEGEERTKELRGEWE
jgi:hypothetical protein